MIRKIDAIFLDKKIIHPLLAFHYWYYNSKHHKPRKCIYMLQLNGKGNMERKWRIQIHSKGQEVLCDLDGFACKHIPSTRHQYGDPAK